MKVIFFGSSDYCLPVLETLHRHFSLVAVITKSQSSPSVVAQKNHLKVFSPVNIDEILKLHPILKKLNANLALVADYGLIIPKKIFSLPQFASINIHFSKLPKLRGASPVQFTILNGDKNASITIQKISQGLDEGDIIWQKDYPLTNDQTAPNLYKFLFKAATAEIIEIINHYTKGEIKPAVQKHQEATYTRRLTRNDGYLPYALIKDATAGKYTTGNLLKKWPVYHLASPLINVKNYIFYIENAMRAFTPWPGLWTIIQITKNNPKRLKLLKLRLEHETRLVIDLVQLEGKKPVSWPQFQKAYNVELAEFSDSSLNLGH